MHHTTTLGWIGTLTLTLALALTAGCKRDKPDDTDSDGDGVADVDDAFPDDPSEWADSDGDGIGDNGDAFPDDPNETVDSDGDGVGDNGDVFPDDPAEWADTDSDGVGDNSDCAPGDPAGHTQLIGFTDDDGDTWTLPGSVLLCTDGALPAGYAGTESPAPDCDDADENNWISCTTCLDGDADASFVDCDAYVSLVGPDCDDDDENNWISCATCADLDADAHHAGCDAYVTLDGPDCDDADVLSNPAAHDLPDDGIDQDCDGADLVGAVGPGVYVDPSADCPGVGTIAEPWCDLQDALDNAVAGDALFLAGGVSSPYPAFTVDTPVGLFGGFEGGYQDLSGYHPGTWVRDPIQLPARVEPGSNVPVVVDLQPGSSGTTIEDFVIFGSTMTTGSVTTIKAGDFPDGVQVTLAHNTIGGGSTPYGNSTVVSIYDTPGQSVLVGNAIDGGHSGGGSADATGVQLLTRAVLLDNIVYGLTADGTSNTTGLDLTAFAYSVLLVHNDIDGGSGGRHSMAVANAGALTAIGNVLTGNDSTEFSYGVSSPQGGSTWLFGNVIDGGDGDLESYGVSSFAWNYDADTHLVNNVIDPGSGASSVGVRSRGGLLTRNNDIWGPSMTTLFEYYEGTGYVPSNDLALLNACTWLYCVDAGDNLSSNPLFVDFLFHIDVSSPLLEAGTDPAPWMTPAQVWYASVDVDGDARPRDGDGNGVADWDIGWDEL
jgi:hypothetical protein